MKFKITLTILAFLTLTLTISTIHANSELTPMEELGKNIFFDTDLSTPPGMACAACHAPEVGFTGPDSGINMDPAVSPCT